MSIFNSVANFARKTYKENVSEETRENISLRVSKEANSAKTKINEVASKYSSSSGQKYENEHVSEQEEKLKKFEKLNIISILHIREDNTKLVRVRGVPFVCILDGQSAKDSGRLVWKICQKSFPYIVDIAIGKISHKNLATRTIHKGWSFYNLFRNKK